MRVRLTYVCELQQFRPLLTIASIANIHYPNATLIHPQFSAVKADDLKAFVYVRMFKSKAAAKKAKFKAPNKGKLATARQGENNLIKLAFDARRDPVVLEPVLDPILAVPDANLGHREPRVVRVLGVGERGVDVKLASAYLADAAWCSRFDATFKGGVSPGRDGVNADLLVVELRRRLRRHVTSKVAEAAKQDHWVWNFVMDNINIVAAMAVRSNHVVDDMAGVGDEDAILSPDLTRFLPISAPVLQGAAGGAGGAARGGRGRGGGGGGGAGGGRAGAGRRRQPAAHGGAAAAAAACVRVPAAMTNADREGAYLFHDASRHTFIRSGKAGRAFGERLKEHAKGASLATGTARESRFYNSYVHAPSIKAMFNSH